MPCYRGTTKIRPIYYAYKEEDEGPTIVEEIGEVYKGNTLVYTNNKVIYLGEGQTFNIYNVYPDYKKLTVDNFFILSANSISASRSCPYNASAVICYTHDKGGLEKSYDKNTGMLTLRFYAQADCATVGGTTTKYSDVKAVLVENPKKLIELTPQTGGKTYSLASYDGYSNFTVNNFLIKDFTKQNEMIGSHTYEGATMPTMAQASFTKAYNKNTGLLTCYAQVVDRTSQVHESPSHVYLYKLGVKTS